MKKYTKIFISLLVSAAVAVSCVNDLDVSPIDPDVNSPDKVLTSLDAYQQLLAKCYSSLAVSASEGPNSSPDIEGIDGGFGQYMRALFNVCTLPTDEASCVWNDQTIKSLHGLSWTTSDVFVTAMFSRIYYQIGLCNEFIRQANSASEDLKGEEMDYMIAQARALRALSYYHAIDLFGNVPFSTEDDPISVTEGPDQISRYQLYEWLVDEIAGENGFREGLRPAAGTEYGRCSQEFATILLAKLYLNAEVFTSCDDPKYGGEGRGAVSAWDECIEECQKIISAYPLKTEYPYLFSADNNLFDEIIFAVQSDADQIQSYGNTNFIIKSSIVSGNSAWQAALGVNDGWGGLVVTPQLLDLFESGDKRYLFTDGVAFGDPHTREVVDWSDFSNGYCQMKFTNLNHDGSQISSTAGFPNTDYPIFRASDAYLMLAEAELRRGGIQTDGEDAFNAVRERAGLEPMTGITLEDIIDERGREFYWENMRRQDLIRFGLLTSDTYLWDWKGGIYEGQGVADRFNLFPIPSTEINANGKLEQNPGY